MRSAYSPGQESRSLSGRNERADFSCEAVRHDIAAYRKRRPQQLT
uniref:Uncharacterized protein n=1 Tax=Klebsiella pneumoniae TaxID=573 RepID=A0A8B0SUT2_KLEPN|nr:hypothetical protein [Klebsiella pneumoniae]